MLLSISVSQERMLVIEECGKSQAVTILVRGGNKMIVAEGGEGGTTRSRVSPPPRV